MLWSLCEFLEFLQRGKETIESGLEPWPDGGSFVTILHRGVTVVTMPRKVDVVQAAQVVADENVAPTFLINCLKATCLLLEDN